MRFPESVPTIASNARQSNRALKRNTSTKTNPGLRNTAALNWSSFVKVDPRKPVGNLGDLRIMGTDQLEVLYSI